MIMTWWILSFALLAVLVVVKVGVPVYKWRKRSQYLQAHIPAAPDRHWLRGTFPEERTAIQGLERTLAGMFPRVFLRWLGPVLMMVSVTHPETLAEALRSGDLKFKFVADFFRPWLGNGLANSEEKRWQRDRRILLHAFAPAMLKEYVNVYKEACSTMLDLWSEQIGKSIDTRSFIPMLTFDVILKCAMGVDADNYESDENQENPCREFHAAISTVVRLILERCNQPWLWWDRLYFRSSSGREFLRNRAILYEFSEDLIRRRREELHLETDSGEASRHLHQAKDMLSILLTVRDEDGAGLSDVEIREQVDTFLFAGRDTSSAVLQWAMYYLVKYPEIQEKCRHEVMDVMSQCGGIDSFSHEHISQLQYLTQFVQECLRCSSVVPYVFQELTKDTTIDGTVISAGTVVQLNITGVHYNDQVWDDPDKFNPDRFSTDHDNRHPYAFVPFSAGARSCIGKHFAMDEMRVVLAMILMKFVLFPADDMETPKWLMKESAGEPFPSVKIRVEEVEI